MKFAIAAALLLVQNILAVEFIAHRGASFDAPENTLASVKLGYEQGADGVEIDIHLTKDEKIVVMHDYDTARTGGGPKKKITDQTLEEIRKLNVGHWGSFTNKNFNEKAPTLAEVLKLVPAGKKLFIEIKTGPEIIPALERDLKAAKQKPEQLVIITFNYETAKATRKTFPQLKTYWLVGWSKDKVTGEFPNFDDTLAQAKAANVNGLDLNFNWPLDKAGVKRLRDAGLEWHVWTVDDPAKARDLIALGVDSITTNRPQWLREQLSK